MSGPPKCTGGGRSGSNPRIIPIALYGLRVGAVHRDSSGSVTSRQSSKPAGRCSPSVGRFDSCAASLGGKARGCAEARRPCQAIVTTELVHMSAYESTVFALSRTPFALSRQRLRPCAIRFRSYSVALTLSSTACTSLSNRRAFHRYTFALPKSPLSSANRISRAAPASSSGMRIRRSSARADGIGGHGQEKSSVVTGAEGTGAGATRTGAVLLY
jgi:hypothetical protein